LLIIGDKVGDKKISWLSTGDDLSELIRVSLSKRRHFLDEHSDLVRGMCSLLEILSFVDCMIKLKVSDKVLIRFEDEKLASKIF